MGILREERGQIVSPQGTWLGSTSQPPAAFRADWYCPAAAVRYDCHYQCHPRGSFQGTGVRR
ncbi:MAG: hypothetical protein ABIK89_23835, partial [Planctomycetota bacterium]